MASRTTSSGGAGASSASGGKSSASDKKSRDGGGKAGRVEALCTLRVMGQRYAVSTKLVRELIEVTAFTPVPLTPEGVLGLFNLRGEPMPLVELGIVLGVGSRPPTPRMPTAILRSERMSIGARIDAMDAVVPNTDVLPSRGDTDKLFVGFLPDGASATGAIAVIDPDELLARLMGLKLR